MGQALRGGHRMWGEFGMEWSVRICHSTESIQDKRYASSTISDNDAQNAEDPGVTTEAFITSNILFCLITSFENFWLIA